MMKGGRQHMFSPIKHNDKKNDPTEKDDKNVHQFLDSMATYSNAVVIFHASEMILCADTDT